MNLFLRSFTIRMSAPWIYRFSHIGAVLGGIPGFNWILGRMMNLGSTHPDFQMRLCDAFDWYSPRYQHHHTEKEVLDWFREARFENLTLLRPEKVGRLYGWFYHHNLIIGSGVNVLGQKRA